MAKIVFRGSPNFRVLTAADLKSKGVEAEFSKTSFPRNTPVEVDDAVADALLGNKVFGKFERVSDESEASADTPAKTEEVAGASAQEATGTPSTTTTRASTRAR